MRLPAHKTKIVATIGPASESDQVLEEMIQAGMNVARLNFSHGDFDYHARLLERLRAAARKTGRRVAILADLPGPKLRIGTLAQEPVELRAGDFFTLTTQDILGDARRVSVSFQRLPEVVKPGDTLFLNDGLIQLQVAETGAEAVKCRVVVGGELRSRQGLNLPGVSLGISAFTPQDRECLAFALKQGVDAVSQSFVESAQDIKAVREAAAALGHQPFVIAKIERANALKNLAAILEEADGLMIARGDLGVEIPIEQIAGIQKQLVRAANLAGKPVIIATQMLESMTMNLRPTRAEATDVANAILDGTDCVMLSGESAVGKYPVAAVNMLARIAAAIEPLQPYYRARPDLSRAEPRQASFRDLIALSVQAILEKTVPAAVFVPTRSGATARSIARFRPSVWIVAVSSLDSTCQRLMFTYGAHPVHEPEHPENWKAYVRRWLAEHDISGDLVVLTEGPSSKHPEANHRIELIEL
jgi:pyruvate kinase|uniref:Pyruvate kinase n=1 Tax=Desulfobacca acetoxidans TaxID=60893 RepID=A0A7C3WGW4_9BACT